MKKKSSQVTLAPTKSQAKLQALILGLSCEKSMNIVKSPANTLLVSSCMYPPSPYPQVQYTSIDFTYI